MKKPLRKNPVEDAMAKVVALIDELVSPKEMAIWEYEEFLEELLHEVEGRMLCVEEEKNERGN